MAVKIGINADSRKFYRSKINTKITKSISPDLLHVRLLEFANFISESPILNNNGGMGFWHAFALYNFIKIIQPIGVIESGVYRGLSTWLIERLLPNARILSIDPALSQRIYVSDSKNVIYSDRDFRYQDFSEFNDLNFNDILVFFDDHSNHMDRLSHMMYFGFSQCIFDDNYFPHGDCISLKHLIHKSSYNPHIEIGLGDERTNLMYMREGLFLNNNNRAINYLNRRIKTYTEFPAPFSNSEGALGQVRPVYSGTRYLKYWTLKSDLRRKLNEDGFAYPVYVTLHE